LDKTEYQVRTDLGLAPSGYLYFPDYPSYGTGQGIANLPVIWLFFLTPALYTCYDELAIAAKYCAPDRAKECSLVGMVDFVDDNGNQTNNFLNEEHLPVDTWRKVF
jgi:hypothetical protein